MCQILRMLQKWKKAILEICYTYELKKKFFVKDDTQVSDSGAGGQCNTIQINYVVE